MYILDRGSILILLPTKTHYPNTFNFPKYIHWVGPFINGISVGQVGSKPRNIVMHQLYNIQNTTCTLNIKPDKGHLLHWSLQLLFIVNPFCIF